MEGTFKQRMMNQPVDESQQSKVDKTNKFILDQKVKSSEELEKVEKLMKWGDKKISKRLTELQGRIDK